MGKKRLVSGIKSTGTLHIGNYFGAMQQQLALQEEYESFIFIADYHSLTTTYDAERLRESIYHVAAGYLAAGINPEKTILFKQSDIPEHMELAWIFNCITTMPYLMRAHAFKDAEAKNKEISVGTFDYPILMAADILMYDATVVPVGKDQQQHIEYARDIAEKFNRMYGETFATPKGIIPEEVATLIGTDGQKMSKSYGNTIPLFAFDSELEKLVKGIVTDSKDVHEPKDPDTDTVFAYHRLFSREQLPELEKRYREGGIGYKESKEILLENMKAFITPMREAYTELMENRAQIREVLQRGAEQARPLAAAKLNDVRKKVGVGLA
ncbi:tryptophan--tRNA ligase [Candidatus Kaiserbacteria bacterium CG10_big_fil_rev_8_21_14_0_10_49_17]|uniref:Tryptophan--tRNA ligase n=1 Tax=Candidatus Kaiserbacteria bacterium CG10_big_fil_rev_8_21_14_0_10_49_17 TaxID=1974609 RepID=A0A2M6WF66_9BACT|nr:MAG: tryptophan--tRNA ligase [Candidatus Kaiserbacteria bacterium CG10_big_fil_rev_8_21_14_0_10_49_17]